MRNIKIILFTFVMAALASCAAKKPAKSELASPAKYDTSLFDYSYSEALKQKMMGNESEALTYLEQCRQINPNSDAVYYQMAQILIGAGNLSNVKSYAKRAWELDKKNIWYSSLLSDIYFQENKLDSAIYIYEEVVTQSPDDNNLLISLANLYSQKGDYNNAVRVHQAIRSKYGINEHTTPAYISNLVLAGKLEVALEETQEAIKLFPAEMKFHAQLADIYSKKGETAKAVEVYRQLLEENPQNPQILMLVCDFMLDEQMYDELFQALGIIILDAEISKEEKISFFSKIIAMPNLADKTIEQAVLSLMVLETVYENDNIVLLLRPELLDKNNRKADAIKRLEEIISKQPGNYYAWEKLLLLYFETKDFRMLMTRGEECASRFNRSLLAKILYANGALENKRYDVALEELRKAGILAGENKDAVIQVLAMKAEVFYRMDNLSETFQTFEEAMKVRPDDMTILNNYAYYLAEQDMELKKAEKMSRKVIEHEKDNATFLDTYAWVLFKKGNTREAARIMEQVISRGDNISADHYEHYGYILQKLKKCEKAVENWQLAMKLDNSKHELNSEIENCSKR